MRAASKSGRAAKTLVRPALCIWACNLLAAVLAAQCSNPTQVPNQTIGSGSTTYSDNNALTASNVVIDGSASVTFVAGDCIQLLPGFQAIAGTAGNTFNAWVETAPSAMSVSPSSGAGLSQQFTWTVSSPSGYSNLADVFALFNTSVSGANACYIHYNRPSNLLYVADTTGANWSSGTVPGSSGTTGSFNPYCTINGSGSSFSASGTQLSVTVSVTFQTSFSGTWNNYLIADDSEGLNTTWQQMGTWTVGNPAGFTPIRISAGGPYTDSLGQYWSADYGYLQGSPWATSNTITGTADQTLYQTERYNDPTLTYQFSVPNGNYTVTLKLAEIYDPGPGQRYMNIVLNGTTVVTGLDVWTAAGGEYRAYDLSYPVSVTNGLLTITLTCTSPNNSGEVNSIQIVASTTQQYSLTTAASPSGSGTVTFSPPCCAYNTGTQVTITASAASGYQFSGWTGVDSSSGSTGYVTITANRSVTANFSQVVAQYQLTTNVNPPGSGSLAFSPPCCTYNAGTQVAITATPVSGYQISGWTGVDSSSGSTGYVTMSANRSVTANFSALDPRRTGVRPTGAYWGAAGEQIDLLSGNLNFSIPLIQAQARGGSTTGFALSYNSQVWRGSTSGTSNLGVDAGYGFGWKLQIGSILPVTGQYYLFTDSTGAQYHLDQNNGNNVWTSREGIYISYDAYHGILYFPSGTFWVMGSTSASGEPDASTLYPTLVEDSNGNQLS